MTQIRAVSNVAGLTKAMEQMAEEILMENVYPVTGTLTDGLIVTLGETITIPTTRVRVIVEPTRNPKDGDVP